MPVTTRSATAITAETFTAARTLMSLRSSGQTRPPRRSQRAAAVTARSLIRMCADELNRED